MKEPFPPTAEETRWAAAVGGWPSFSIPSGLPADDLDGLRNIHAFGYHASGGWGGAGTVLMRQRGQAYGDLYIDDNLADSSSSSRTLLTPVGFGTVQALTADTLTTDGTLVYLPGALVGLEVNPNVDQTTTFTVVANTASTLVVNVTGGTDLTDAASVGDTYAGVYRFDNVVFRRGGFLWTADRLSISDTLRIGEYGRLTHLDTTTNLQPRLEIGAGSVVIEASGAIDLTARGYLGGLQAENAGITLRAHARTMPLGLRRMPAGPTAGWALNVRPGWPIRYTGVMTGPLHWAPAARRGQTRGRAATAADGFGSRPGRCGSTAASWPMAATRAVGVPPAARAVRSTSRPAP